MFKAPIIMYYCTVETKVSDETSFYGLIRNQHQKQYCIPLWADTGGGFVVPIGH